VIVLIVNSGSSSLKYEVFNLNNEKSLFSGAVTRIGMEEAEHSYTCSGKKAFLKISAPDHLAAIEKVLEALTSTQDSPLQDLSVIGAVAHLIGHGGSEYRSPVMPLHHPAMLKGIEACEQALPGIPQVAVFDTAFHSTIPDEAAIYGLPYDYFARGIRKFGFHGNSHDFVAHKAGAHR